ncbi:hypothetical protein CBL_06686 [Carabus blaptoides fortunei]
MTLSTIGQYEVKHLVTGVVSTLDNFWKDKNCVVIFFRRWGCQMCRLYAKELSDLQPILRKHDIDMIGVGLEDFGAQEFVDGKFFDGELYVDNSDKQIYKAMEFKRFNVITILASLLWADSRAVISKSRKLQVPGNLSGDTLQTGGALIVGKGGNLLYEFKQTGPADHLSNSKILEVLGLQDDIPNLPKEDPTAKPECTDECTK